MACANTPIDGPLLLPFWLPAVDFHLLDALTFAITGNFDASSMRRALGRCAHRVAGKSAIRALDHIGPGAVASAERRVVRFGAVRSRVTAGSWQWVLRSLLKKTASSVEERAQRGLVDAKLSTQPVQKNSQRFFREEI